MQLPIECCEAAPLSDVQRPSTSYDSQMHVTYVVVAAILSLNNVVQCRQVHAFGWASVFYIFGSLGVVWFVLWLRKASSGPVSDTRVSEKEREYIVANTCEQVRGRVSVCSAPALHPVSMPNIDNGQRHQSFPLRLTLQLHRISQIPDF